MNDWNNDGKITDEDKQIYGCTDPKWVGSLSSNMYYKGFDFSVMIYTKQGQWARSYFHDKYKWYEGQIAVNDWNNDGKITDEDKQIYG